ncbi:MAG: transposase [Phycisphaeraceae bacterium]|nr:transposase [Phycisphaeraceae bacterium]
MIPRKRTARRRRPGRPADFDRERYRRRNTVERCIGWLKGCRRVATRFEKLATHFLGMIHLAIIQRCLRLLAEPSNTAWFRWRGSRALPVGGDEGIVTSMPLGGLPVERWVLDNRGWGMIAGAHVGGVTSRSIAGALPRWSGS